MSLQSATTRPAALAAPSPRLLLASFAATLFLSACLLFLVQPMVSKMLLPHLGGSPGVWNTCMCFFQAVLLLGYAYAHLLARIRSGMAQGVIHAAVLALAALFLPFDLTGQAPPADGNPAFWLVWRLFLTVGPPFFAISATAPLLQRWFSRTNHAAAGDPYFLYAASNAGSLLALLAYPLAIEPEFPLWQQSRDWSLGVGLLAAGIAICWFGYRARLAPVYPTAEEAAAPARPDRLRWTAYAFIPSALLLATTGYITSDIGSAPLFWVVPLALYLLTFIVAFSRNPALSHPLMLRLQPWLLIPVVILSIGVHSLSLLALHLGCFFVTAMVCHGELARTRPPVRDLTEFYLCVSLGGVLGGVFVALLAPLLFPDVWEYPLLLAAACLFRPAPAGGAGHDRWADFLFPAGLLATLFALLHAGLPAGEAMPAWRLAAAGGTGAVALLLFSPRRLRLALGVGACLVVGQFIGSGETLATARSFFGVNKVRLMQDGAVRVLQHGTTVHGAESTLAERETEPFGYYNRGGPFGRLFAAVESRHPARVGVIGLGTGSLACYATPGQSWIFHEIDPVVAELASDTRYFRFLARCGEQARIVLGDARLTLQDVADHSYGVLVVDAFSSDSIPLHLLTREALALYFRKLTPDGVILFHVSNRYLDLAPVIAALAQDAGAPARHMLFLPDNNSIEQLAAEVMAVGAPGGLLDELTEAAGWKKPPAASAAALWTDDRSGVVGRIKWH